MNYININVVMDKLTRHPLLKELPFETVIDYTVDFIRIVGTPPSFLNKTALIDINEYRGKLPCDFYEMIQVRTKSNCNNTNMTFRYTTDTFHMSPDKPTKSDLTYQLQGDCIFTAVLDKGQIEISYYALPIDEEGFPLIPDNSSYIRALQAFIKREYFTILFDEGKINGAILQKAEQDYAWYVGQAQTDLIRPSIDQMQSISNLWNTLIHRDEHRHAFLNEGTQNHIKIH